MSVSLGFAEEVSNCTVSNCTFCCVGVENLCLDEVDGSIVGKLFEVFLLCYAFVAVAIVADDHLVVSLETLCVRWSIREDVAGASFMAFGSAAPEIIINAVSTLKAVFSHQDGDCGEGGDDSALGIGAIIGSGMIAFTVIPGCCGLATKAPLLLKRRPLGRDALAYLVALVLLHMAITDGVVELKESLGMVVCYACYMLIVVCSSSVRQAFRVHYLGRAPRTKSSFVLSAQEALNPRTASPSTSPDPGGGAAPLERFGGMLPSEHAGIVSPLALAPMARGELGTQSVPQPAQPEPLPRVDWTAAEAYAQTPQRPAGGAASAAPPPGAVPSPLVSVAPLRAGDTMPSFVAMPMAPLEVGSSTSLTTERFEAPGRPPSTLILLGRLVLSPLRLALYLTCPECAHDGSNAAWCVGGHSVLRGTAMWSSAGWRPLFGRYPVTLLTSFAWVALMSTVIAAIVSRWGELLHIPVAFLGMCDRGKFYLGGSATDNHVCVHTYVSGTSSPWARKYQTRSSR